MVPKTDYRKIIPAVLTVFIWAGTAAMAQAVVLTANGDAYGVPYGEPLVVEASGVLDNDTLDNEPAGEQNVTVALFSDATFGSLTLNTDGSFSYTPGPDFPGSDTFTYRATSGTVTSQAIVRLTACSTGPDLFVCWMEAPFAALLMDLDYSRFQEGFEDDAAWGALREPVQVKSATSQGITWTANAVGNQITTGDGPARTGNWGIYDPDHGSATGLPAQCDIDNPPETCLFRDGFTGTRTAGQSALTAVGAYFQGSTQPNLKLILDKGTPISLGRLFSPEHQFFGAVDTTGFTSFRVEEVDGKVGNERLVFADDFIFATGDPLTEIPTDTYSVLVTDSLGSPVANALVNVDYAGTAEQTTDQDGLVDFLLPDAGGTFVYTVTANGYVAAEISSSQKQVTIELAAIGAMFSGVVQDSDNAPLAGALVTAYQPDDIALAFEAATLADGTFRIDLPTGAPTVGYTVVAAKPGYAAVQQVGQAPGTLNFTGGLGLQAKTAIVSVAASAAGGRTTLTVTAEPAFSSLGQIAFTLTSGTGTLEQPFLANSAISVVYAAMDSFTVVILADTSEDNDPATGYAARYAFRHEADDPAVAATLLGVDVGGASQTLSANNQTMRIHVPVGGFTKPATILLKQVPKTVDTMLTEGSEGYVYAVSALDSITGMELTADEVVQYLLTLPVNLNTVKPKDLESGFYAIYQAPDLNALESGDGIPLPASGIMATDYVGDGALGSVTVSHGHFSFFGIGAAATNNPPLPGDPGGGGDGSGRGGGCFILTAGSGVE